MQNEDESYGGGANRVSLASGRENYVRCGACEPTLSRHVRSPLIDEIPPPPLVVGLDSELKITILRGIKILLLGIVRAMLAGDIGILEGCSAVTAVAWPLNETELDEISRTFVAVASETDEFPTGATRQLWSPEALRIEDAKAADYERRIKESVQNACIRLEGYLRAELCQ